MRRATLIFTPIAAFLAVAALADDAKSDADYIKGALSAAPAAVAKDAAVVRMADDGTLHTLRKGSNGFTCLIMGTDKMCNDPNSMDFLHAVMKKEPPPNKVGISYMLAGDVGASNTDPFATGKTADLLRCYGIWLGELAPADSEDQAVTVRDRDTMQQERVGIDALEGYLAERLGPC